MVRVTKGGIAPYWYDMYLIAPAWWRRARRMAALHDTGLMCTLLPPAGGNKVHVGPVW
jgi:hypothetical protein